MGNIVSQNVIYGYESGVLITVPTIIKGIYWGSDELAAISATNDVLFKDLDGDRIWGKRATSDGDGDYVPFPDGLPVNGITVSVIDGGYFYIYR